MKRLALVREIRLAARRRGMTFELVRAGGRHDLYRCGAVVIPIPRHREIADRLAAGIRVQLEPALGERWWR